jgi:hypothetical protein
MSEKQTNPVLAKLGLGSTLEASQLIATLHDITDLLTAAIKGDESIISTQGAAFDISIETATASSRLAYITQFLRNPPPATPTPV